MAGTLQGYNLGLLLIMLSVRTGFVLRWLAGDAIQAKVDVSKTVPSIQAAA